MNIVVKNILREDVDKKVKFVILYGSRSQGTATSRSDTDIAIFYDDGKKERFRFRVKLSGILGDTFDVQIFQDLPLYVRKEVLKGKVLYEGDVDVLYETAMSTIKEFDRFKKHLDTYYEGVEQGGIVATI